VNLAGQVAVITGGASGIGRASALALARRGVDIVLADIHAERLARVADEICALGPRVLTVQCDVAKEDDVAQLARQVELEMGPVGILMNNAGVVLRGALEEIALEDWRWCLDINVFGVIHGIHAFLPQMVARRHGWIVNTGSVTGLVALTGEGAPYVASKFAVVGLTEALALYCRPLGIGVSLLCPGGVNTNLAETGRSIGMTPLREVSETRMARTVQGGTEVEPEYIGELVANAIQDETFLVLQDGFHAELVRRRAADLNAFMSSRWSALSIEQP
jgi:NAD(P)-dependent dehydrogenase (short-subunit alcohol dehydrogenase family)